MIIENKTQITHKEYIIGVIEQDHYKLQTRHFLDFIFNRNDMKMRNLYRQTIFSDENIDGEWIYYKEKKKLKE